MKNRNFITPPASLLASFAKAHVLAFSELKHEVFDTCAVR
jgi:hypothetical protein